MNYEIVADESVDFRVVTALRAAGLIVYSVAEELHLSLIYQFCLLLSKSMHC
jgi:hypothetical protein